MRRDSALPPRFSVASCFDSADRNDDGALSQSELEQASAAPGEMAGPLAPRFERIDANSDGYHALFDNPPPRPAR